MEDFVRNLLTPINVTGHISEYKINLDTIEILWKCKHTPWGNIGQLEFQLATKYYRLLERFILTETEHLQKSTSVQSAQNLDW